MAQTIRHAATAGFDEKQDVLVTVEPAVAGSGVTIQLQSKVMRQYGKHIRKLLENTVKQQGMTDLTVYVKDNGAWDYTLIARVESAIERGMNDDQ